MFPSPDGKLDFSAGQVLWFFSSVTRLKETFFNQKSLANNLLSRQVIFHTHTHKYTRSIRSKTSTQERDLVQPYTQPEGCFSDLVSWESSACPAAMQRCSVASYPCSPGAHQHSELSFETNPLLHSSFASTCSSHTPPCHASLACPLPSG